MKIKKHKEPTEKPSKLIQDAVTLKLDKELSGESIHTLLHVGCGHNRLDRTTKGFNNKKWNEIRLDIDESVNPDLTGTMTEMSSVKDLSVDAIFSSHNIEHLYPHEVPVALK